ncbi:MAG: RIP metalloprotease RseP [Pseudomonadota bacterium]
MTTVLTSIIAVLVAIGILVAVHEYGHYIVARLCGIRVLRFSIGFGKPIWRRFGKGPDNTEFVLSAIPLGGYVKMLDERDCDVPASEAHRAFNRKPVPARIAVLLAGPAFNFFFAIAAYWVLFMVGVPAMKPVVGEVTPGSDAARAGIERGDTIVAVGGESQGSWMDVVLALFDDMLDDGEIRLTVRDGADRERQVTLNVGDRSAELTKPDALLPGLGLSYWQPTLEARIAEVMDDSPAQRGGLNSGDLIEGAGEESFANFSDLVEFVQSRPGERVSFNVLRNGEQLEIPVTLASRESDGKVFGQVGITPVQPEAGSTEDIWTVRRLGPVAAAGSAVTRTWEMSVFTVRTFGRMLTGDVSLKNISGPINIARYAGQAATVGGVAFLSLLAILSISLGILNLLPVPILDGGQIVFQTAEWIKGSPLSPRVEIVGQQVGLLLLLALMSVAFYNDILVLKG